MRKTTGLSGDVKACIAKNELFEDLDDAGLEQLAGMARLEKFPKGKKIFGEGEDPKFFTMVFSGQVKVYKTSSEGQDLILEVFGKNDAFGTVALLDGMGYPANAAPIQEASVLLIRQEDFFKFIESHPALALKIIRDLGRRLRMATGKIMSLTFRDVQSKMANLLFNLAQEHGEKVPGGTRIALPLTRQEMANMIGITIETAIRVLSLFRKEKIIDTQGKEILISDMEKLRDRIL